MAYDLEEEDIDQMFTEYMTFLIKVRKIQTIEQAIKDIQVNGVDWDSFIDDLNEEEQEDESDPDGDRDWDFDKKMMREEGKDI